jgi:hypothetical protein
MHCSQQAVWRQAGYPTLSGNYISALFLYICLIFADKAK